MTERMEYQKLKDSLLLFESRLRIHTLLNK